MALSRRTTGILGCVVAALLIANVSLGAQPIFPNAVDHRRGSSILCHGSVT